MERISPTEAYYIKLGRKGHYEKQGIEVEGTIRVGFREVEDELAKAGNWDRVRDLYVRAGRSQGAATDFARQLQIFYEAGEDVLWITFYKNRLWWCFARADVQTRSDGSKIRPTVDGWHDVDIQGNALDIAYLSGRLTMVQGYRGTICSVSGDRFDYLVRKINGDKSPQEQAAIEARASLVQALIPVIKALHWKEFELLTDLLFREAGWQRISQRGEVQKTLDLDLVSPITGDRSLVQIKSEADRAGFEHFLDNTAGMKDFHRYYFVVHTPSDNLGKRLETDTHYLWLPEDIAERVVSYGLVDWLIKRAM